jgi:cell division septum initiation protein DivIVA
MPDSPEKRDERTAEPGGVAEAMNRVLAAERAAMAQVEACRAEADRTLEAARREAHSILERAERLARDIHGRTERLAAARARRLVEEDQRRQSQPESSNPLVAAVERLAARMTGAGNA